MILKLLLLLSIATACPPEKDKPKMFKLTPCSQCKKDYRECMEGYQLPVFGAPESKEQLICEDTYVACFRQHNCQSEGSR